jgi:hypothetical protein
MFPTDFVCCDEVRLQKSSGHIGEETCIQAQFTRTGHSITPRHFCVVLPQKNATSLLPSAKEFEPNDTAN